jgi:urate oxidase
MSLVVSALITGIISLIVGIFIGRQSHSLAFKRDQADREHADQRAKEARRSDLLSTLKHWENTFVVVTDSMVSKRLYYTEGMKALATAAEKFRGDVADKDTFDRLNYAMSAMNPETLDADGIERRRETICGAIRAFYDFNRNA